MLELFKATKGKVSVPWQCFMCLTGVLIGIYAFQRIKKLRLGGLIYLGLVLAIFLPDYIISEDLWYQLQEEGSRVSQIKAIISLIAFLIVPAFFVVKWSKEWNKSIDTQNLQPSS